MKHKFVIEVQISPLAFSQILKRIDFYKSQGIYLLWVVDINYIDNEIQQFLKDILGYNSKYNEVFSLNYSGQMLVHYQAISYWRKANKIWKQNKSVIVNFNNLDFNEQTMTVCYYNREKIRKNLYIKHPMLLLNHLGHLSVDSDKDLLRKLEYYKKHYSAMEEKEEKFIELIDAIFFKEYKYWNGQYYDIFLFLIKDDKIKTLSFLLDYGLRRRAVYKPQIDEKNYDLLKGENVSTVRNELVYYYFLEENIPNRLDTKK